MVGVLILLAVAAGFIGTILRGWILSIIWTWFMVPVFHLPALSISYAIGISIVIAMLTKGSDWKKGEYDTAKILGDIFVNPFITLLIAYVVKAFV